MVGPDLAIITPAFNEESTIGGVVLGAALFGDVIVVDDGSEDATAERARVAGADVVKHDRNRGYDAALDTGVLHALRSGYTCALIMDADGQHRQEDVGRFVKELERGSKMVVGVRPGFARFMERVFAVVARWRWGLEDPLCGMKAFELSLVQQAGGFDSYQSVGTQLLLWSATNGVRICQIPINIAPRTGAPRFGTSLRANLRIFRALVIGYMRFGIRRAGNVVFH